MTIQRQAQNNTKLFREAVRRHFKAAVAQERGRMTCFQFNVRRGASEHRGPLASEAERDLNAADVVDLRSLSLFRRQKQAEMPEHLRNAIGRLTGGYKVNKDGLGEIGKLLGVGAQTQLRYPGGDKAARDIRRLCLTEALTMNMLRNTCFRQVRAWAATNMVLQSTSLSTPQTTTTLEFAAMLRDPMVIGGVFSVVTLKNKNKVVRKLA